ncbi:MAG: hypothetical protein HDT43_10530 [Ruminococcaceae bacterium]|nr:hypothetical protein [Oscillospiraceae bacterium]
MKIGIFIALFAVLSVIFSPVTAYAESTEIVKPSAIPEKYLDEQETELYRQVLKNFVAISEGRQSAETFYIDLPAPFPSKKKYEDAVEKVMYLIRRYTPEYNFWEDSSGYLVYSTTRCGIVYGISPIYQAQGNANRIDPAKLNEAKKALANAQAIADKYKNKSAYDKIIGYVDEICALNTYNDEAVDTDGYSLYDITPWRIISVFDGDPSTNAVCAGYAWAFQYLCALGGIECHYVSGTVSESHAWNIVELDGKSYFVDVTFCDGFPEEDIKRYHPYVLDSVVSNAQDGFSTYFPYVGRLSADMETYKYDDGAMKYLPESLRTLSTGAYRKPGLRFEWWHLPLIILVVVAVVRFVKRRRANHDSEDY